MDVKLQKGEWEGLGADERAKIQQIIAANFAEDVKVIPDSAVAAARQLIATRQPLAFNLSKPICAAACGVAEAAAASQKKVARREPTGRREAPPDDRLREIRGQALKTFPTLRFRLR